MSADPPASPAYRLLNAGDGGLVVEFGTVVDERLNRLVIALDARLRDAAVAGVIETVPTYRSLLVLFDPARADRVALAAALDALVADLRPGDEARARRWTVPVAYGGALGMDLDHIAALHDLTTDEVVRRHAEGEYRVHMIGFAPGFAYLGGLPAILHTPRRTEPRQRTPAGSISIGGVQAAISSVEVPSGWHMLGRTPLRTFDLRRDTPFLLQPGDRIRFRPVSASEYARLTVLADGGAITADLDEAAA